MLEKLLMSLQFCSHAVHQSSWCAWLLGLFSAFDENLDSHIDFKEMACGISACCRGPMVEKHKCKSLSVQLL